jgi:hypothetical protein
VASADERLQIPVSADEVWPLRRNFGAIHEWAPPVADAAQRSCDDSDKQA